MAALIVAGVGWTLAGASELAATQPAAATGLSPDAPPEILSMRHRVLAPERYRELAEAWESYVAAHPEQPRAWIEWGDALRYSGRYEEAQERYERAYAVDSNDVAAVVAYAGRLFYHQADDPARGAQAEALLRRALALDPSYAEAYYTLFILALRAGDEATSRLCLERMVELGDMPAPLFDYGYNMIAGAPPGAIILTNGDNDTYPPLAVQALTGERPDVAIVNLSLLNTRWYVRHLRDQGLPITLDDAAIEALRATSEALIAAQMQRHLFENLSRAGWPRPLLYAITVMRKHRILPAQLLLEGLLERIVPAAPEAVGESEYNLRRTRELFDAVYRIDGATDPRIDWEREAAVRSLGLNYAQLLARLGIDLLALSPPLDGEPYLLKATRIFAFHRADRELERLLTAWEEQVGASEYLTRARVLATAAERR